MRNSANRLYQIAILLSCVVFSTGLFGYILIGTTSRYLQDDYCYSAVLRGGSFWQQQIDSYLHETTYSGNRFSLTLGMALSELAGPKNVAVLPGVMLVLWLVGLYLSLRGLQAVNLFLGMKWFEMLVTSEAIVLFTLSMTPNWVQSYLWRAGMFPYFAPLVTGTFLVFLLLKAREKSKWRPLFVAGVFITAVVTGGFSETAAAIEITFLCGMAVLSWWKRGNLRSLIFPTGAALAGGFLALALLFLSPTTSMRLHSLYGASSNIPSTLINSLNGGFFFYVSTAYRMTLPYAAALTFFGLLGFLITCRNKQASLTLKGYIAGVLGSLLGSYILTVAAVAPSFFAESSYPGDRALVMPRFISILLALAIGYLSGCYAANWRKLRCFSILTGLLGALILFAVGVWVGEMSQYYYPPAYPDMRAFLRQKLWFGVILFFAGTIIFWFIQKKFSAPITISTILLFILFAPGLMAARIYAEYPVLHNRAVLADMREAQILSARDGGEREIDVRALDSLAGIAELSENTDFWVNNCAELYYGVESIRASEPVMDTVHLENPW